MTESRYNAEEPQDAHHAVMRFHHLGNLATALAASIAVVVLLGWFLAIPSLTRIMPSFPAMAPNTAAGLLLSAFALFWYSRDRGTASRLVVSLIGLLILGGALATLGEYVFHVNLGIDSWLFSSATLAPEAPPGRPSPEAAIAFASVGAALLALGIPVLKSTQLAQPLVMPAAAISILALTGYLTGYASFYSMISHPPIIGMALPASIAFLALSTGILAANPTQGPMSLMVSSTSGGVVARRLLAVIFVTPLALGVLLTIAGGIGLREPDFRIAFSVLFTMSVFMFFTWIVAKKLRQADLERRRIERSLQRSEERTQALFTQAPEGIFVADLDGRYTSVNPSGALMLGYAPSEIIGKTIMDLIPPEDIPRLAQTKLMLSTPGASHTEEWRLRRKDGDYLPVEVSAKIMPDGRWQAFVRDISLRKKALAEIAQAHQELERMRDEWTAVVAHDLRQPLAVITMCTEALCNIRAPDAPLPLLPVEQTKLNEMMRSASNTLNRMINDLLDYSRIEAKQMRIDAREIDPGHLARSVVERLRKLNPGTPIKMETDRTISRLRGDALRIEQVLVNLITNALKYGDKGREIEVSLRDLAREVEISVTNFGQGIPPSELSRVFDRFARTPDSRRSGTPGLGLGLYISKGLIEAHGGRIWVESTHQRTTFHFTIPKAQAQAQSAV